MIIKFCNFLTTATLLIYFISVVRIPDKICYVLRYSWTSRAWMYNEYTNGLYAGFCLCDIGFFNCGIAFWKTSAWCVPSTAHLSNIRIRVVLLRPRIYDTSRARFCSKYRMTIKFFNADWLVHFVVCSACLGTMHTSSRINTPCQKICVLVFSFN